MKPPASVGEAHELIAFHAVRPEYFRLPVRDELQDPGGASMTAIDDAPLGRGWGLDVCTQKKGCRIHEYTEPEA